jgi:hypothetical protein
MDCAGIAEHLVEYHLGTLDELLETRVEGHLLGCGGCVKTYLALKRATDRAGMARPSPSVHLRLREELARNFTASLGAPRAQSLARRILLWKGVALAAIATSVTLALPRVLEPVSISNVAPAQPTVDTSRAHAESLRIY